MPRFLVALVLAGCAGGSIAPTQLTMPPGVSQQNTGMFTNCGPRNRFVRETWIANGKSFTLRTTIRAYVHIAIGNRLRTTKIIATWPGHTVHVDPGTKVGPLVVEPPSKAITVSMNGATRDRGPGVTVNGRVCRT